MSEASIYKQFDALESRMSDVIELCSTLRLENQSLKHQQESLVEERARLIEKNEMARRKVEQMIVRLKSMESGQ